MENRIDLRLIALGCVLCLASGLLGGFLALALSEPDVVYSERVIDVRQPVESPSEQDLAPLIDRYVSLSGETTLKAEPLVGGIAAMACTYGHGATEVRAYYTDISIDDATLTEFIEQVQTVCP
jgi:hypothetical protein